MKKFLALLLTLVMSFAFTACGRLEGMPEDSAFPSQEQNVPGGDGASTETPAGNILVAYFSWADNAILEADVDAVSSPSVVAPGNVQQLAGWVQEETGADIFAIRVVEPYSSDWDACLERANQERGDQARPALQEKVENMEQYDTVFLGYPNWWYGVPMALLTFLEENDLSGKQVYLFCSHGTGGLSNSVDIISEAIPNAVISDNIFDCYEEEASSSQADIQSWVLPLRGRCGRSCGRYRRSVPQSRCAGGAQRDWNRRNRTAHQFKGLDKPYAETLFEDRLNQLCGNPCRRSLSGITDMINLSRQSTLS